MGVLMMAATIGGLILAVILLVIGLWTRMIWLTKFVLGATAIWFAFYAVMLFGFSLLSEQKMLGLNKPKAFRGFYLDCLPHTEIADVRKTKMPGDSICNPRLDISEGIGIDKFIEAILIDDKDSVLYRRNYFKLEEHLQTVSAK